MNQGQLTPQQSVGEDTLSQHNLCPWVCKQPCNLVRSSYVNSQSLSITMQMQL